MEEEKAPETIEEIFAEIRKKTESEKYIYRGENRITTPPFQELQQFLARIEQEYQEENKVSEKWTNRFIDLLEKIKKEKEPRKICSTLYREYSDIELANINQMQESILTELENFIDIPKEIKPEEKTRILSELQHYRGKTNLIDFSEDFLIALFFACDGEPDEDGRLILYKVDLSEKVAGKKDEANKIKIKYPPKNQNNRVIFQKSIFVEDPKGYIENNKVKIITIKKGLKEEILNYLKTYHKIYTQTVYQDTFGFIENQEVHHRAYKYFYTGLNYYYRKEYKKAAESYNKVIKIKPNFLEAYNNRGGAKSRLKKYDEAITDYNKAIKLNPNHADTYYNRGNAKFNLRKYEEAIEDFNKVIELNPNDAETYSNRGNAKSNLGQYEEAIEDFNKVIELNPNDADAYANRGNQKINLGQNKEAIVDHSKAIELNPNLAEAYPGRGLAKFKLGEFKEAKADLEEALALATAQNNQPLIADIEKFLQNPNFIKPKK